MPTNTDPTTMTPFGDIPLSTRMATAVETAAVAAAAAQTAVESITEDLEKLVSTAYKVKGTKTNYSDLPAWNAAAPNTPENGDVWNVTNANGNIPAGTNYVFVEVLTNGTRTGGSWDALGGTIDLSAYVKGVTIGTETQTTTPDQNGVVAIPMVGDGLNTSNDGLMSSSDKYKLDGIATGAQVNVLEGVKLAGAGSALTPSSKVVTIPNAVATGTTGATNGLMTADDKAKLNGLEMSIQTVAGDTGTFDFTSGEANWFNINGSGPVSTEMSSNSMTISIAAAAPSTSGTGGNAGTMSAADKEKLNGVSAGAQVNTIESVKVNGTALTPDANKAVNIPKATGSVFGAVELSDATDGTAAAASGGTAATPKAVKAALDAAKAYADTVAPDLSSCIKKSTVKGKIDTPPSTLANLPANAANLTLNQILNALYAGASESES